MSTTLMAVLLSVLDSRMNQHYSLHSYKEQDIKPWTENVTHHFIQVQEQSYSCFLTECMPSSPAPVTDSYAMHSCCSSMLKSYKGAQIALALDRDGASGLLTCTTTSSTLTAQAVADQIAALNDDARTQIVRANSPRAGRDCRCCAKVFLLSST